MRNAVIVTREIGDYTVTTSVDQSPAEVFAAINNVRGWWNEDVEGITDRLGAQFTYDDGYLRCRFRITDFVPERRVVWHVEQSDTPWVKDKHEWNDTDVIFEVSRRGKKTVLRFTHRGLVPEVECFNACSDGWNFCIGSSLRSLITTGKGRLGEYDPESNPER
jgi:hypothetical protein